jgi:glycosyltransferase involved in cell wall biosynthesis
MPSIGVAICCYKGHIPHLRKLLDSIQSQTRKPDHVVVSCSSSSADDIPYRGSDYSFPLTILTHQEYKNAAQNRNCAAAFLKTDIISFFDADDVMHPQRLQFIDQCFSNHNIMIFMHNCITNYTDPFEYFPSYYCLFNALYRCPWGSTKLTIPIGEALPHNAHASVRREVLADIKFREDPILRAREDTIFCGDVISRYPHQTAYCHNRLSQYSPSGSMGPARSLT